MRLITPPLPAASRPSNRTTTLSPCSRTDSWSLSSSNCSRRARRRSGTFFGLFFGGLASPSIFQRPSSSASSSASRRNSPPTPGDSERGGLVDLAFIFIGVCFQKVSVSWSYWKDPRGLARGQRFARARPETATATGQTLGKNLRAGSTGSTRNPAAAASRDVGRGSSRPTGPSRRNRGAEVQGGDCSRCLPRR